MAARVCPNCGFETITQSSYCEKCMTEFPATDQVKVVVCPECFLENDYRDEYCIRCNELLKPGQAGN